MQVAEQFDPGAVRGDSADTQCRACIRAVDEGLDGFASGLGPFTRLGDRQQQVDALVRCERLTQDVQAVGDQGLLQLLERRDQGVDAGVVRSPDQVEVQSPGRVENHRGELGALGRSLDPGSAPAFDQGLEIQQALVEAGVVDRRRDVADQGRVRPPLGDHAFGRIVGGVEIQVRHIADQPVGPAGFRQAGLLAGHEFQRAMGAEMQNGVGPEILTDPAVEGAEGVGRGKGPLEHQPHRIAFDAEGRLQADEDVSELGTQHEDRAAVGKGFARRRAPDRLDIRQPAFAQDMLIGRDADVDIAVGAVAARIALQQPVPQRVHRLGNLDGVALGGEADQGLVQAGPDRHLCGGSGGPCVGREVEQDGGDLAVGAGRAAQGDHLADAIGQGPGALGTGDHRLGVLAREGAAARTSGAGGVRAVRTAAEHHGCNAPVQFGDGDHHRGLQGKQALRAGAPLLERLELQGVCRDVGHVEPAQDLGGGGRVVVGGPADQREAGQVDHGVHRRAAVLHEQLVHRRAGVEAVGEGGDDAHAARFERVDDAVVVGRVSGQNIGAQDHQPYRAVPSVMGRQGLWRLGHAAGHLLPHARVIDADLGVFDRGRRLHGTAQGPPLAIGITVHQIADHRDHVLGRAGEPVLQRQEIGADVLGRARDEGEDPGQAAQHGHLLFTGDATGGLGVAAQLLEHGQRTLGRAVHAVRAHPGQLHDLGRRHHADHGVAGFVPGLECRQDHLDVVIDEQHRGDDDVARGDVGDAGVQRDGIAAPFRCGVQGDGQVRCGATKFRLGLGHGAGQMVVQGDDDDSHLWRRLAEGCGLSGCSAI